MNKTVFTGAFLLLAISIQSQTKSERLDSIFSLLHQNDRFNGVILIAEKGVPIFEKSYGLSNVEKEEELTNDHIFKLNSITKQFTAMGIIALKQEGKLHLDDPLSKYIPELKFYENVSIRHLLNHTHGIPDYDELFEERWDKSKIATNKDIIALYEKYRPQSNFDPGEKFLYGGIGFELLAVIIERVSNQAYNEFLTANIFAPLQMENTFDYHRFESEEPKSNIAIGYIYSDSLKKHERPELLSNQSEAIWSNGIYGSGNIHTTASDLLKWDRALRNVSFISKSDLELIYQSTVLNDKSTINYGFGWWLINKEDMGAIAYHAGNSNGFETHFERHLDSDKTIIVLQNFDATTPAIQAIHAILYDQALDFVVARKEVSLSEDILKQYEGTYVIKDDILFNVFIKDAILFAQLTGQSAIELCAESQRKFFVKKVDVQFEFVKDKANNVDKMLIFQNGNIMEASKSD